MLRTIDAQHRHRQRRVDQPAMVRGGADQLAGHKTHPINYGNIPNATYCHPEVASIGLTEQQCKDKKLDYKVGKFPFSASGRARPAGETEGFVKILRDT